MLSIKGIKIVIVRLRNILLWQGVHFKAIDKVSYRVISFHEIVRAVIHAERLKKMCLRVIKGF